ncbi:MAG: multicopper oxidase domain-containing protein [Desulfobaccales bacterium]
MSVASPANTILRQSVVDSEGLWTKMFDPPRYGPPTPELLNLPQIGLDGTTGQFPGVRANPVPSVMIAAGMMNSLTTIPYTAQRSLMHGFSIPTWDQGVPGRPSTLQFFLFADDNLLGGPVLNPFSNPQFPAPTYRAPRGAVCHNHTDCQGPPPHTIHWHGIEPTPMNDGVGHCSFEVQGSYIYQWQPNFIGTYFYHCHRNTMQHFEFGLAGIMPFHPPDAWFASIASVVNAATGQVTLNATPIGAGRDGLFRTAANLSFSGLPSFPGYIPGNPVQGVNIPDPWTGDPFLKFPTHPHAFTVPYDVEAIWVVDDRDSVWSALAPDPFTTFPQFGTIPGVNDQFALRPGSNGFFNFNDFNADYWYVTGVPVPGEKGTTAVIDPSGPSTADGGHGGGLPVGPRGVGVLPPQLNSGMSNTQVSIAANRGETVFIRNLCAAYNSCRTTFPVDVVIIEWDGRALGVPPLNRYTRPQLVKAGTPIVHSTARRWGAILNVPLSSPSVSSPVKVEFLDTRSTSVLSLTGGGDVVMTALIPFDIN